MPEAGADLSKPFREGNLGHFLAAPSSERSISCHGFGNWSLPLVVELKRWADCDRVAEWTSGHLGSSWLAKPIKRKRIMVKALAALPPKPEVSAGSCRLNTSKFWLGLDFALAVIQSIHFCVRTPQPRPAEELETRALFLVPAPATAAATTTTTSSRSTTTTTAATTTLAVLRYTTSLPFVGFILEAIPAFYFLCC